MSKAYWQTFTSGTPIAPAEARQAITPEQIAAAEAELEALASIIRGQAHP